MTSFCQLVIISAKYILNSLGERGQPWHTPLLISASFNSLGLNFINILLCLCKSTVAFVNVSGIFLYFKISVITESNEKLQSTKETKNCMVIYSGINRHTTGQLGVMIWIHKSVSVHRMNNVQLLRSTFRVQDVVYAPHASTNQKIWMSFFLYPSGRLIWWWFRIFQCTHSSQISLTWNLKNIEVSWCKNDNSKRQYI